MKDVNDNSTTELELEKKAAAGRPGRKVTRDNFYKTVENIRSALKRDKYCLDLNSSMNEILDKLLLILIDKNDKGSLYKTLRKAERASENIKVHQKHIENIICKDDEDLSEDYMYKIHRKHIAEYEAQSKELEVSISNALDNEIEELQIIVNNIPQETWNKMLAAGRQRFSKLVNRKAKIDINEPIFNKMKQDKERHGLSWDEYMIALLSLSDIEKDKSKEKDYEKGVYDYRTSRWL